MRIRPAALAVVLAAAAVPATGAARDAGTTDPCRLVTAADARGALGAAVGRPKAQQLGLYRSCTYAVRGAPLRTLTVQTRRIDRATFVRSARANPPPIMQLRGLGVLAYSAAGFTVLVWRDGTEATFTIVGGGGVPAEKTLARKVAARL